VAPAGVTARALRACLSIDNLPIYRVKLHQPTRAYILLIVGLQREGPHE
jgi:hypothetical protein